MHWAQTCIHLYDLPEFVYLLSVLFSFILLSTCYLFHIFESFVVAFTWSNLLLTIAQIVLKQENFIIIALSYLLFMIFVQNFMIIDHKKTRVIQNNKKLLTANILILIKPQWRNICWTLPLVHHVETYLMPMTLLCTIFAIPGPFRFSTPVWQSAPGNTVRCAMVCEDYFPFSKIV